MKKVNIGLHSYTNSEIVEEVANVLCRDDFNVELFGVSEYAEHLPSSYQIVDYLGRDTLLVCEEVKSLMIQMKSQNGKKRTVNK